MNSLTLKKVSETRWKSRVNSLQAVRYQYVVVESALEEEYRHSTDLVTSSEVRSLATNLNKPQTQKEKMVFMKMNRRHEWNLEILFRKNIFYHILDIAINATEQVCLKLEEQFYFCLKIFWILIKVTRKQSFSS